MLLLQFNLLVLSHVSESQNEIKVFIFGNLLHKQNVIFKYLDISLRGHDVAILEAVLLLLLLEGEEPPQPGIVPRHGRVTHTVLLVAGCRLCFADKYDDTEYRICMAKSANFYHDGIILTYLTFNVNTNHM